MKRTLVLALALTAGLTGCRGADSTKDRLSSQPSAGTTASATDAATPAPGESPAAATGACTATGKGTTDLKTKPVAAYRTGAEPTETKVYDEVCGTGAEAKEGSNVTAKYVGLLFKDGTEFDSSWKVSADNTFQFQVGGNVIPGFSKGALGMKVGGRREVVIPSADGYGPAGSGPIPADATLIFIIDLVAVS